MHWDFEQRGGPGMCSTEHTKFYLIFNLEGIVQYGKGLRCSILFGVPLYTFGLVTSLNPGKASDRFVSEERFSSLSGEHIII